MLDTKEGNNTLEQFNNETLKPYKPSRLIEGLLTTPNIFNAVKSNSLFVPFENIASVSTHSEKNSSHWSNSQESKEILSTDLNDINVSPTHLGSPASDINESKTPSSPVQSLPADFSQLKSGAALEVAHCRRYELQLLQNHEFFVINDLLYNCSQIYLGCQLACRSYWYTVSLYECNKVCRILQVCIFILALNLFVNFLFSAYFEQHGRIFRVG